MEKNIYIITNNPKIKEQYQTKMNVYFCQGGYIDVFMEIRKHVHEGSVLLTHPMLSSMKPNQTPYRSAILMYKNNENLDYESLRVIENSIESAEKFLKHKKTPLWNDKIRNDFQTVDLSFITNCFNKMY